MKAKLRDYLLIVFGYAQMLVAALIAVYFEVFPSSERDDSSPWVRGLFGNILLAAKRYGPKRLLFRLKFIRKNPELALQYFKILSTKADVIYAGDVWIRVKDLVPQHDVFTDSDHHRERVKAAKEGRRLTSDGGPIITVDYKIHDGHHRVAALEEASMEWVLVKKYIEN